MRWLGRVCLKVAKDPRCGRGSSDLEVDEAAPGRGPAIRQVEDSVPSAAVHVQIFKALKIEMAPLFPGLLFRFLGLAPRRALALRLSGSRVLAVAADEQELEISGKWPDPTDVQRNPLSTWLSSPPPALTKT